MNVNIVDARLAGHPQFFLSDLQFSTVTNLEIKKSRRPAAVPLMPSYNALDGRRIIAYRNQESLLFYYRRSIHQQNSNSRCSDADCVFQSNTCHAALASIDSDFPQRAFSAVPTTSVQVTIHFSFTMNFFISLIVLVHLVLSVVALPISTQAAEAIIYDIKAIGKQLTSTAGLLQRSTNNDAPQAIQVEDDLDKLTSDLTILINDVAQAYPFLTPFDVPDAHAILDATKEVLIPLLTLLQQLLTDAAIRFRRQLGSPAFRVLAKSVGVSVNAFLEGTSVIQKRLTDDLATQGVAVSSAIKSQLYHLDVAYGLSLPPGGRT